MSIYFGSFIIQVLAFALLFILLKKYAFGPLLGIMEKRQESIENQIKSADEQRAEAEKFLVEQQEALQNAREEAHSIIERAKSSSTKQAEEIIEISKAEAERIKQDALQEIKLEKEKAVQELREQVSSISVLIASKIIEKEIDAKTQSKIVDDVINQVGESL